jgi:transcriptional regulator with XRE-family HTH domain
MARKKRKKVKVEHAAVVQRFAAALRRIRLERGMTQLQLARAAQVSNAYIGRLENRESAPSIDTIERIAAALGCTVHDLLPLDLPSDDLGVLREQIRRQVDIVLESQDAQTLGLVAQLLARISTTTPR